MSMTGGFQQQDLRGLYQRDGGRMRDTMASSGPARMPGFGLDTLGPGVLPEPEFGGTLPGGAPGAGVGGGVPSAPRSMAARTLFSDSATRLTGLATGFRSRRGGGG